MGLVYRKINYGIACRIGNIIYYNRNLKKYPELLKAILEHEKEHSYNFNYNDVILDFRGKHLKCHKKEYYKFILTHPKSLTEFLPVCIYNEKNVCKLVYSPTMIFVWLFIIAWIGVLIYYILK
jgi:hypothetical protein